MDQNLNQNVDTLFANMENFTQKEGLIGKPVVHGDKTFLPVVSITLGYGGGNTQTKATPSSTSPNANANTANAGNMAGGALGLGARLCTDAVIIIDKENVSMVPISAPGTVNQMIDKIPQILTNMKPTGQPKP